MLKDILRGKNKVTAQEEKPTRNKNNFTCVVWATWWHWQVLQPTLDKQHCWTCWSVLVKLTALAGVLTHSAILVKSPFARLVKALVPYTMLCTTADNQEQFTLIFSCQQTKKGHTHEGRLCVSWDWIRMQVVIANEGVCPHYSWISHRQWCSHC